MATSLAYVIGGLLVLLVCGDLLVRGAVSLAKKMRIPALFIGLTIVAFGTSAPEFVVGIQAALADPAAIGIAVGNVVGSNIANVLIVLGLPALIYPIHSDQPMIRRNTLMMVGATGLFTYFAWDLNITLTEGFTLFALIFLYLLYTGFRASRSTDDDFTIEEVEEVEQMSGLPKSPLWIGAFILFAVVGLPLGAHYCVMGAQDLAVRMGVSPSVIGLTVIALGTSLPELATSLVAAMHRHSAVAIGNVIGSNLFNILAIMGATTLVAVPVNGMPIPVDAEFRSFELWVLMGTALLVLPYALSRGRVSRVSGIFFILGYVAFIWILFQNGGGPISGLSL